MRMLCSVKIFENYLQKTSVLLKFENFSQNDEYWNLQSFSLTQFSKRKLMKIKLISGFFDKTLLDFRRRLSLEFLMSTLPHCSPSPRHHFWKINDFQRFPTFALRGNWTIEIINNFLKTCLYIRIFKITIAL